MIEHLIKLALGSLSIVIALGFFAWLFVPRSCRR